MVATPDPADALPAAAAAASLRLTPRGARNVTAAVLYALAKTMGADVYSATDITLLADEIGDRS